MIYAAMLMKAASNGALAHHLEAPEAAQISRQTWGHNNTRGTTGASAP